MRLCSNFVTLFFPSTFFMNTFLGWLYLLMFCSLDRLCVSVKLIKSLQTCFPSYSYYWCVFRLFVGNPNIMYHYTVHYARHLPWSQSHWNIRKVRGRFWCFNPFLLLYDGYYWVLQQNCLSHLGWPFSFVQGWDIEEDLILVNPGL